MIGGLIQERESTTHHQGAAARRHPAARLPVQVHDEVEEEDEPPLLLTPYIINDPLDLEPIRQQRQREYDEFMNSQRSLDGMKFDRSVDYARKRGVVEEINRAVQSVEEEAAQRALIVHPSVVPTGPVTPKQD